MCISDAFVALIPHQGENIITSKMNVENFFSISKQFRQVKSAELKVIIIIVIIINVDICLSLLPFRSGAWADPEIESKSSKRSD